MPTRQRERLLAGSSRICGHDVPAPAQVKFGIGAASGPDSDNGDGGRYGGNADLPVPH
eukprot:gene10425-18683_t